MRVLVYALALAAALPARAEPAFAGAIARAPALFGIAMKVSDALGKAFAQEGAADLSQDPQAKRSTPGRVEDLKRLLDDARGRYLEGDFKGALSQTSEALRRFEEGYAYEIDEEAWALYAELMLVRALAQGRLGWRTRADRTMAQLCATRPDYVPDPGLAPPKVASRYQAIRRGLMKRQVSLEVTSRPAGAEIVLNGRSVGITPQTLQRLLPGRHYVSLRLGEKRWNQRVFLREGRKGLATTLTDPRRPAAEAAVAELGRGVDEASLARLASPISDDVYLAVVEPAAGCVEILLGRVKDGALVAVVSHRARDDLSDLDDVATNLALAALKADADARLDDPSPAGAALRERFLGTGLRRDEGVGEGEGGGLVLATVAALGGLAALAAVAVGVGAIVLLNQPPNLGGTDIILDASNL